MDSTHVKAHPPPIQNDLDVIMEEKAPVSLQQQQQVIFSEDYMVGLGNQDMNNATDRMEYSAAFGDTVDVPDYYPNSRQSGKS